MKMSVVRLVSVVLYCLLMVDVANGQTLTVSTSQLNFGNVYENAADSLPLTVTNNLGHEVQVTAIKFYTTYGSPAFSTNASNFNLPGGSSQLIWIKFSPRHNISHNSEMVIYNDALRGTVRVDLVGQGKYSLPYYNATENLSEENLKTTIRTITGIGYDTLGYNLARDTMFMWMDNQRINGQGASQNTLECIYTGRLAVGYISRQDAQNTLTYSFNTEHTFPQGFFPSAPNNEPMRSDLHHIFPTDDDANNYRSNNPFGIVTNPTWSVGGSKGTTTLFEPRDQQKGRTARAMMYFVLRYQDYTNFFSGQESILRTWHHDFSPTQVERKRNNDIYSVQNNRNPFVDYPQFIERIFSIANFSIAPVTSLMDLTQDTIVYGYVQPSVAHVFHYVIVNHGNTAIYFSNISVSNSGLFSFLSGGNDTIIDPGEALGIDLRLFTSNQNSIHDSLMFQTDVTGFNRVKIPIYANDPVVNGIQQQQTDGFLEAGIQLYPNPTNDKLFLTSAFSKIEKIRIVDVLGKVVKQENKLISPMDTDEIDVSRLNAGIYFLLIQLQDRMVTKRIVKN